MNLRAREVTRRRKPKSWIDAIETGREKKKVQIEAEKQRKTGAVTETGKGTKKTRIETETGTRKRTLTEPKSTRKLRIRC